MQVLFTSTESRELNKGKKTITQPPNLLTQAITDPKICLTQPKNALTQYTGNYVVACVIMLQVSKKPCAS